MDDFLWSRAWSETKTVEEITVAEFLKKEIVEEKKPDIVRTGWSGDHTWFSSRRTDFSLIGIDLHQDVLKELFGM